MAVLKFFVLLVLISCSTTLFAQGFLHTEGDKIVDGNGENVILRGIGTGNWMVMEGYMMKTEGVAGTQHEFKAKLEALIGEEKTNAFFDTWLQNQFTKTDVDSMKAWGFNSVRVAMHYKLFTLPIEEEPIAGKNTWLLKGFKMIDNLLSWCADNEMYLILDLHAAPGGQGANADISDYDPSKPSLWESEANKAKTVALWRKLAERYSNSQWIGGYDLINETNWTFSEPNNQPLRDLLERITTAIREVDMNHIVFIEGNSFANDHSGLTPPWDDNFVYSFHKYWSGTSTNDLDWIIALRNEYNVPLWMGESGENSNTWFTELIASCEQNNIGWSWWPVKKNGINNVLFVPMSNRYQNLVRYLKGEISTAPSALEANQAVLEWAKNQKIENNRVQRDVIDAMIRQPHTDDVIPYVDRKVGETVYFTEYDLGKNGFAYYDKVAAYYGGDYTAWNTGWELRNDGVDIEKCLDTEAVNNGYNVGWTEQGEWMKYTIKADSTALYTFKIRYASGASGGMKFHLEANGARVSEDFSVPSSNGWQNWKTASFQNVLLPAGNIQLKFVIDQGESNLSYFEFTDPKSAKDLDFEALSAHTATQNSDIFLVVNKAITSDEETLNISDFQIKVDGKSVGVDSVGLDASSSNRIILSIDQSIRSDQLITISYSGTSVKAELQNLESFTDLPVENNAPLTHAIPGKIEAEAFELNRGLSLENCTDQGGGQNTSYAAPGEYLDYRVNVTRTGIYQLNYRVATEYSDAELVLQAGDGENFTSLDTIRFESTGGWQNWETQTTTIRLEAGYYFIRLLIKQGEHNLNWFQLDLLTSAPEIEAAESFRIYPNPANQKLTVEFSEYNYKPVTMQVFNIQGSAVKSIHLESGSRATIDVADLQQGIYLLRVVDSNKTINKRFLVTH